MKKLFTSILAVLYLSTSVGASIHLHYCMGKLVSWGLINHESRSCSYCGMEKKSRLPDNQLTQKNCCHDDHQEIRTGGDQNPSQSDYSSSCFTGFPVLSFLSYLTYPDYFAGRSFALSHAPPVRGKQPVFLLHCHFRI